MSFPHDDGGPSVSAFYPNIQWRNVRLAVLRFLAACRIVTIPSRLQQLWALKFMRRFFRHARKRDTFFFLTHDYYLSRYFTVLQRVDCAIAHYRYESNDRNSDYHRLTYESMEGLLLWRKVVNDTRYTLFLRATDENRYEGDLSVLCFVNESRVCRMSFSYVDSALFGPDCGTTMFVTRNQTDRNAELKMFRSDFKQNSPPYFCMAAICGIAMANGMRNIFTILDDAQIAYDKLYADGFRNSYSAFWSALGAQETGNKSACRMPIPLQLNPLTGVKHKARALSRRRHWLEIAAGTRRVILEHRVSRAPPPIDAHSLELLAFLS